jgi:hypothetical protein
LLEPIVVDKNNLNETVVRDGYQKTEDVYKNAIAETKTLKRREKVFIIQIRTKW